MLGTTMLSVLAGHTRYAHITALRNDGVLPELLGMKKIVSEDAVRRGFKAIDETEGAEWLRDHLEFCTEPLLAEPWVLDIDTTVKPLYGHQEGAVLGYNPKKPGRPSHCYHTYLMASPRLVLDVESVPATSIRPNTARQACGRCWTACRAIGPRCCAAKRLRHERIMSEAEERGCLICSSCA